MFACLGRQASNILVKHPVSAKEENQGFALTGVSGLRENLDFGA
jgi:hypothetical protein